MRGSQSPSGFCDDDGFAYQKPSRANALTNTNNNAYQGGFRKGELHIEMIFISTHNLIN